MALVISFILGMKGLTEGFVAMSFLCYYYGSMQANGVMYEEEIDRWWMQQND